MGELINLNPLTITDTNIPAAIARDTETVAAIAAHNNESWPHAEWWKQMFPFLWNTFLPRDRTGQNPTYFTQAEVSNAIDTHASAVDPHPAYLTQVEGDGRYRQSATALVDADIPAAIARDAEVSSAINSHASAVDPHPVYLTQTEGDGRYRQSAAALVDADIPTAIARDAEVASAIANHVDSTNPHPVYVKCAQINVPVIYNGNNLIQLYAGLHSS